MADSFTQLQTSKMELTLNSPLHNTVAAAVLGLGLCCDVFLIARFVSPKHLENQPDRWFNVAPKLWGIPELILAGSILLSLLLLTNAFYGIVALLTHRSILDLAPLVITTELIVRLGILVAFVEFFRRRSLSVQTALGLTNMKPLRAVAWGIVFGFASLPPMAGLLLLGDTIFRALGIRPSDQPIAEFFATTHSQFLVVLLVLFAIIIAPIFEEFIFRGFAYPAFKQRFGPVRALMIVSGLFALTHLHPPSLVPLFVLALGLGLAYEFTGTLLAPMTMHAFFNAIMVLQILYERAQS
jgi:membrane protease YdiL (CAAX protease family)